MAYLTYTTCAYVAKSRERGSSDKTLWLFTEDAGMVVACAAGVRDEKSKMRYALQDFSFARVSLVRGRAGWRVTGAEPEENIFIEASERAARARVVRMTRFLLRCVQGEDAHPALFVLFREGLKRVSQQYADDITEAIFVLRALHLLGYVSADEHEFQYMLTNTLEESANIAHRRGVYVTDIEAMNRNALEASHL